MTTRESEFERLERETGWRIADRCRLDGGTWILGPQMANAVSYPDESRVRLAEIESRSFWFRHRNRILLDLLDRYGPPPAFWELGSGNGFVAWSMQEHGIEAVAVEPGVVGARLASQRGVRHSIAAFLTDLELPDNSLPALGFFDVLEHIAEPELFLKECYRVLRPGGWATVTVPAGPILWSQADEDAGHFRRYTRRSLDKVMQAAGFDKVRSRYMMFSLWLPLFLLRALPYRLGRRKPKDENLRAAIGQLSVKPGLCAILLDSLLWLELKTGHLLPWPLGTSIVSLYRKPP